MVNDSCFLIPDTAKAFLTITNDVGVKETSVSTTIDSYRYFPDESFSEKSTSSTIMNATPSDETNVVDDCTVGNKLLFGIVSPLIVSAGSSKYSFIMTTDGFAPRAFTPAFLKCLFIFLFSIAVDQFSSLN